MAWVVIAERQKQIPINSTRIRNGRYPKKNDPFRIGFAHVSEETPFLFRIDAGRRDLSVSGYQSKERQKVNCF